MTLVVTGASGSIGGQLIETIRSTGLNALGVSRKKSKWTSVAVSNYASETPLEPDDTLVHLAEQSNISRANQFGDDHVAQAVALVNALVRRKPRRFVYVSSAAVYDDKVSGRKTCESAVRSNGAYVQAKLAAESVVRDAGGVVVRLANVYGPTPLKGSVFDDIVTQLDKHGPVSVRQVFPVRDYIWLHDATDGLAAIAAGSAVGTYNLGSGTGVSVGDLARRVLSAARQTERDVRGEEIGRSEIVLDITSTEKAFNWRPMTTLDQGLDLMLRERTVRN